MTQCYANQTPKRWLELLKLLSTMTIIMAEIPIQNPCNIIISILSCGTMHVRPSVEVDIILESLCHSIFWSLQIIMIAYLGVSEAARSVSVLELWLWTRGCWEDDWGRATLFRLSQLCFRFTWRGRFRELVKAARFPLSSSRCYCRRSFGRQRHDESPKHRALELRGRRRLLHIVDQANLELLGEHKTSSKMSEARSLDFQKSTFFMCSTFLL